MRISTKITDSVLRRHSDNLGVFFYKHKVHSPENNKDGLRSYEFRLKLTQVGKELSMDQRIGKAEAPNEDFSFICTIDLKDYIKVSVVSETIYKRLKMESREFKSINYDKIVNEFFPSITKVQERLLRKIENNKTPQTVVTNPYYNAKEEFLYFNKDTADSWSGPYEFIIKGKKLKGCVLDKNIEEHINTNFRTIYSDNNFLDRLRSYHIPKESQPNGFDEFSSAEKLDFLNFQDIGFINNLYKKVMYICKEEELEYFLYNLHLSGNDDTSYTKGFHTKDKLQEELEYLRMMQPLDMYKDIQDRGYVYTN